MPSREDVLALIEAYQVQLNRVCAEIDRRPADAVETAEWLVERQTMMDIIDDANRLLLEHDRPPTPPWSDAP